MANGLRELSRYNANHSEEYINAMHRVLLYALATPNRVPLGDWGGNRDVEFEIVGAADASYNPYDDTAAAAKLFLSRWSYC